MEGEDIISSDEDGAAIMAAFKRNSTSKAVVAPQSQSPMPRKPEELFSHSESKSSVVQDAAPSRPRRVACVLIEPIANRDDYTYYEPQDEVVEIVREYRRKKMQMYEVKLESDKVMQISFEELHEVKGGQQALHNFQLQQDSRATASGTDERDMQLRTNNRRADRQDYVDISTIGISSSEEEQAPRRPRNGRTQAASGRSSKSRVRYGDFIDLSTSDDSETSSRKRQQRRKHRTEPTRRSARQVPTRAIEDTEDEDDEDDDDDDSSSSDILRSDVLPGRKRKRRSMRAEKQEKIPRTGVRQSERSTRAITNMEEARMDDVFRSDSEPRATAPKLTQVRETFETLPRGDPFRSRHAEGCEVCFDGPNVAPLIYCQGCSQAYHKNCLGTRSSREHLATKVDEERFVLQCKRCINTYKKKDHTAPDLSKCQDCGQTGPACKPFKKKKTTQQEMKDREENDGKDPITHVSPELINNPNNVLFRCTKCSRAWHYHHLPPLSQYAMDVNRDDDELADERLREYSNKWKCKECEETDSWKVGGIIAWRPSDVETYRPGTACAAVSEDEKQYLIKWEKQSYFRAAWFSGAWTWGVTAMVMRKAFFKREDGPKMRTEDAVPEEYLRIDIVLDIKYTNYVEVRSEEIDKARIKEVDKALIKYKGLGYEDAVWEKVPTAEDGDRWLDFVTAYNDWVAGRYVKYPKQGPLKARLDKARTLPFAKLEKQKQPDNLVGGELMKYQIEGLNWLYYQWYCQKNGILADEMGLGKTIQVIAFMATLVQEHNCFPFLIVVPNSTAANWRREIKQWVPTLRVVAYFGSAQSREMAYRYEMYPEGTKELRCHIVVTSYEAAADGSCQRMFRSVNWGGLIVDEGQRLKNDKSQLYTALRGVKAPFRLLMTGTPLQNNARELFNLLQFLDETIDAAVLEEKYAQMTAENIKELHDQIRPFILRRTKAQVLGFLPPLGQVILPISMSHLQKTVYKTILSKSPELLKALFTSTKSLKQQERANLSNILMQLRKCLCHPFVYSREIEERTDIEAVSHRNLVEASAKLSLLEMLLPKLKERGHRVLIFSQFLDMLNIVEDFLDGMQMAYQRLDGQMGSLEKQKRIDQFNAPDSPLFAFLLSTRAGGVGINLATADTVIILDPDWNPHQDIQAIARAHRIGQKKKVLCFQLMTRATVEEKIIQMGRTKMALDHVVVEQLDADDIEEHDVKSILKFGAAELFKDDNADQDIRYDDESIEKLLDRSQIESTRTGASDDSAEAQFSFARVWANDKGSLQNDLGTVEEEIAPDPGVWDRILKERQAVAAAEALARAEAMGRGRRARGQVDYTTETGRADNASNAGDDAFEDALAPLSPVKSSKRKKKQNDSESDTDFQADTDDESEADAEPLPEAVNTTKELGDDHDRSSATKGKSSPHKQNGVGLLSTPSKSSAIPAITISPRKPQGPALVMASGRELDRNKKAAVVPKSSQIIDLTASPKRSAKATPAVKPFKRAQLPIHNPMSHMHDNGEKMVSCPACRNVHPLGACALKEAGVEHCGLCGLAHYGHARTCPHIKSETQVREMLLALKSSPEQKELVDLAVKYLRGVKGALVQQKKRNREKAAGAANGLPVPTAPTTGQPPKQATNGYVPYAATLAANHDGYVPYAATLAANTISGSGPQGQSQYQQNLHSSQAQGWSHGGYSGTSSSMQHAQQQRAIQMQAQGQLVDQEMAIALRNYLVKR